MEGLKAETHGYLKYSLRVEKGGVLDMGDVEEHNKEIW